VATNEPSKISKPSEIVNTRLHLIFLFPQIILNHASKPIPHKAMQLRLPLAKYEIPTIVSSFPLFHFFLFSSSEVNSLHRQTKRLKTH
jgi:hypothetical protein